MAYAALVSVSQTLEQILDSDPYFFPCSKEKVQFFKETIASLIAFLDNCPPICTQTVNNLITQIRDSVYEAEDVFESLVATHFLKTNGSVRYEKFKPFPQSLEKVMEDIESIEKEVKNLNQDGNGVHEQRLLTLASTSRPALRGYNANIVALDIDLEMKLMEELVGGRSKIDVIPIVGMGGIGKTTLARILCDSQLIRESFEIHGWVTISQTYNAEKIVFGILKDIGVPLDGKKDDGHHLYQCLYDRKYLIVLDDVWDTQAWDDIKRLFPDNNNGSRIILTTRHSKVAAYANSFNTYHEMQLLNEDSTWSLLCQEIFNQNNCPPELVETGKEIARQCQGLPLAISAIGGHLKKEKQTEEYWKFVSENVSSVLKTTDDPSLEILTLSYNYLPHHLKACFLYFGSFLEDNAIYVSEVVRLWVAEGFIKPSRSISMEEVAEEYLRDVIERNLVFVNDYDSFGKPKMCGIHDLFRDICIREAKKEKFLYILSRDVPFDLMEINYQRRLILSPNIIDDDESPFSSIVPRDGVCSYDYILDFDNESVGSFSEGSLLSCASDIEDSGGDILLRNDASTYDNEYHCNVRRERLVTRSLIYDGCHTSSSVIGLASGLLKVLNVRITEQKFPVEVLELVNITYLELGHIKKIPWLISKLRNLQTLIAQPVYENFMPSEVWEMPRLRHLLIGSPFKLPAVPDVQVGQKNSCVLKSLQTLSKINCFRSTQEVISRIPNLKILNITYGRNSLGLSFYCLNNLVYLCELQSLNCKFWSNENILQNLAFPRSLKKLVLEGSQIPWEQMSIIGILPNLEVLKLKHRAMKGELWETNDGEFKQLKFLLIRYSGLVEWRAEKDHFPNLRQLVLRNCYFLEAIPSEIGEIPTLEIVELDGCSPEAESSAKEILGEDSDIELKIINSYALPGWYSAAHSSNDADTLHDDADPEAMARELCDAMQSSSIN